MWVKLWITVFVSLVMTLAGTEGNEIKDDVCGYAPLCGSERGTFEFLPDLEPDFDIPTIDDSDLMLLGGGLVEFGDCCSLRDTQATRSCEVVNPSGGHEREIESLNAPCSLLPQGCQEDAAVEECDAYTLVIRPVFIKNRGAEGEIDQTSGESEACCSSCACYGDPVCRSFDGEHKMWVLCDAREVPGPEDNHKRCKFTEAQCLNQTDAAGNQCQYLAENKDGSGWNSVERGSPCVPDPLSPPSIVKMYDISETVETTTENGTVISDLTIFAVNVEQGERGTIIQVYLTLSTGLFSLSALDCLTKGEDAWIYSKTTDFSFDSVFEYEMLVEKKDVAWNVVDPYTKIALNIRCFSNTFDPEDSTTNYVPLEGVYVPRINVEAITDPFVEERKTSEGTELGGFCVSGEYDYGLATRNYSDWINEHDLCSAGFENQDELAIFREICGNPAMPMSHKGECMSNFCSENYFPLFDSMEACVEEMELDLGLGFCMGIVYVETDVNECVEQWEDLGPIATIQQYYNDKKGCITAKQLLAEMRTTGGACEEGVTIQVAVAGDGNEYGNEPAWEDVLFIPENFCGEDLEFSYCDFPQLFHRSMRFVQKTADASCGPVNICKQVDGFISFIGVVTPPTTSPTMSPTLSPTFKPTLKPTVKPSASPTVYPTAAPTAFPTDDPTVAPTKFPTSDPTFSPTQFPTIRPTPFPTLTPSLKPTVEPTLSPSLSPTVRPTFAPSTSPTDSPTRFPTDFPTSSPSAAPTFQPTLSPTLTPTFSPTQKPLTFNIPPTTNCEYRLCETPELYITLDRASQDFRAQMDSCCPKPIIQNCPLDEAVIRAQGSNMGYCGDVAVSADVTELPALKPVCEKGDKLKVQVSYFKEDTLECCKTCKCFGDPRCYSFNDVMDEFILCDGRAVNDEDPSERCVIRKQTCEQQLDHEGNQCKWWNPNKNVPDYENSEKQFRSENRFSVAKFGSPCQYDPEVSGPALLELYNVSGFILTVEQFERGYIHNVYLTTFAGVYSLNVENCIDGDEWITHETFGGDELFLEDLFRKETFGKEVLWKVIADRTGIELGVRCTGAFVDGKITEKYINIEFVHEPDVNRATSAEAAGFCATDLMLEKRLASTEHSHNITTNSLCTAWNEERSDIMLRNAVREIVDKPGLNLYGVEAALEEFCETHARPRFSRTQECVEEFLAAEDVVDIIGSFCKAVAVSTELEVCEEAMMIYAETDGYIDAFSQGRTQFVENFEAFCDLSKLDAEFANEGDECKLSLQLQFLSPGGWRNVEMIPAEMSKCKRLPFGIYLWKKRSY